MLLWVGLGNPEPAMARQRHNIGFMALDVIAIRHHFSPWRRRFKGVVAEGEVGGVKVLGLKPLTYMNDSGESVQAAAAFYKLPPEQITAFHDELDLVPGKMRVKRGGGSAGHNGLRSMDRMLGTPPDYWRVLRLGIGHAGQQGTRRALATVASGDFAKADRVVAGARCWMRWPTRRRHCWPRGGKPEDFMTKVALLTQDVK